MDKLEKIYKENEIKSNIIMSKILLIIAVLSIIGYFIFRLDVLQVEIAFLKHALLGLSGIEFIISFITLITKGKGRFLKFASILVIETLCFVLCYYGINDFSIIYVIPIVVSCFYQSSMFTWVTFVITINAMTASVVASQKYYSVNAYISLLFNIALALIVSIICIGIIKKQKHMIEENVDLSRFKEESRADIVVSQIQPHFLYNALSTISALCTINPERAKIATKDFADYMRMNLDTLKGKKEITFEEDLKHTQTYLSLEKMRFGDDLNVKYNIVPSGFMVPPLTLQPIVENAVKHGICAKPDGGTVTISTYEDADAYYISVKDDGVGFDENDLKDKTRSHTGMENTRDRIKMFCGGDMIVQSKKGYGTTVILRIPRKKEQIKK